VAGESETGTIDAHAIQPYYTGLIARAASMDVAFAIEGDEVTVTAGPVT
jgi:histidine phosphotransferase ChpT